ncbi:MAG: precorrin-6A synthase (deacetylating) [Solirubrobacterales bacterium]|nr:precorrin-6A synthase (deacetylating) [Solirubrobacterales bacterium]
MRKLYAIGIGAGDPEHVTVQAVEALNAVDVFFVIAKSGGTDELVQLRKDIFARYIDDHQYRVVELQDPERDRTAQQYAVAVDDWRERRARQWESSIVEELGEEDVGGFLVWGDPSLYDSTLAVFDQILEAGVVAFEYEVIAGISSVHALTARHRIPLNRVGGPVMITTGRRLADGFPNSVEDVVVMLDADCSFRHLSGDGIEIFWGAYLGTADEILIAGQLNEVSEQIQAVRAAARAKKGWVMDTYLLRRASVS